MGVLEQFKYAESFAQMTLSDKVIATMYVIVLGMGITFVALVLIWGLTAMMSKILGMINIKEKTPVQKNAPAKVVVPSPVVIESALEDETELVAVISAAIAAMLGTSIHNIVVTNIKRIPDTTPTWGQVGRSEVMAARTY